MLNAFINGILTAWFLSWFGFDDLIIRFFKDTFKFTFTSSQYYVSAGIIALVAFFVSNNSIPFITFNLNSFRF